MGLPEIGRAVVSDLRAVVKGRRAANAVKIVGVSDDRDRMDRAQRELAHAFGDTLSATRSQTC